MPFDWFHSYRWQLFRLKVMTIYCPHTRQEERTESRTLKTLCRLLRFPGGEVRMVGRLEATRFALAFVHFG